MPAKSTSPEAAQKRVWKTEVKQHEKSRRKVSTDFNVEQKRLSREAATATKKLASFLSKRAKQEPTVLSEIDRRIAILNGRIGV